MVYRIISAVREQVAACVAWRGWTLKGMAGISFRAGLDSMAFTAAFYGSLHGVGRQTTAQSSRYAAQ
jgi:hypothetical protein